MKTIVEHRKKRQNPASKGRTVRGSLKLGENKKPNKPPVKKKPDFAKSKDQRPITGRLAAIQIIGSVLDEQITLEEARNKHLKNITVKEKKLAAMISNTTFRYYGVLHKILNHCLSRPVDQLDTRVRDVLLAGATQLYYLNVPAHAAINESVEMAPENFRKLVNAILRRLQREQKDLTRTYETANNFLPRWLYKALEKDYGQEEAAEIATAHLEVPPLDITVFEDNTEISKDAIMLPNGSLRLPNGDPTTLPGFDEGYWQVQDAAATLPVKLLGDVKGKTVLDLCAAPGGKTIQLCKAGANVIAVDHNENRLRRLKDNIRRLNVAPKIVQADVLEYKPKELVDAILLDAPCTATGTLRRHPELCWRSQRQLALPTLVELQQQMLQHALSLLKPGGILVYAVCSLLKEEGEQHIDQLLQDGTVEWDFQAVEGTKDFIVEEGSIRTLPHFWQDKGGIDSFYMARLRKKA